MDELKQFLETKEFPGKVIFAKVWGSRSHNTQLPTSDWDFSGVYVVPTKDILSMDNVKETVDRDGDEKPDYSFHEAGHFCRLLLVGNPGILEMLFTEKMYISSPVWDELRENRKKFLSKNSVRQYLGYAEGQLRRAEAGTSVHTSGGKPKEKWCYHLARVLFDAERIVNGGEPVVWKEGLEWEFLMKIRHGEYSFKEIMEWSLEKTAHIKGLLTKSNLSEKGDKEFLKDWIIRLRLSSI